MRAIERHRLKGNKERAFSELLGDFDLHRPPCRNLRANEVFYWLGSLTFNLLQSLKLIDLPVERQPKRIGTPPRDLLLISGADQAARPPAQSLLSRRWEDGSMYGKFVLSLSYNGGDAGSGRLG